MILEGPTLKAGREALKRTGASSWPLSWGEQHIGRQYLRGMNSGDLWSQGKPYTILGDGMQTLRGRSHCFCIPAHTVGTDIFRSNFCLSIESLGVKVPKAVHTG